MSLKDSDITDKERKLIENVAQRIVNSDTEFFALLLLQTIKPVAWISAELGYFFLAPFLPLLEDKGYELLDTFEERKNIEILLERVEQLSEEKEKKVRGPSLWSKLRKRLPFTPRAPLDEA